MTIDEWTSALRLSYALNFSLLSMEKYMSEQTGCDMILWMRP